MFGESLQHGDHLLMLPLNIQYLVSSSCTISSIILVGDATSTSTFIHDLNLVRVNALNYNQLSLLDIMLVTVHEVM
jgi:hypothetical protein